MKFNLFSKPKDYSAAFEALVLPHVPQLHRLAYRYCGNRPDAEDLVQDLLIKLYPRTEEIGTIESLKPWLAKSLYHLYIDRIRAHNRSPINDRQVNDTEVYEDTSSTQLSADRHNMIRDLQAALDQLEDKHRILIIMHDVESYTLTELETILDAPVGTLKSRLHRGRAKLRNILDKGTFSDATACKG